MTQEVTSLREDLSERKGPPEYNFRSVYIAPRGILTVFYILSLI
jgi:hypothetical protein